MKLPLVYYGNPKLRKKAHPIEEITDEIRLLADNMLETMDANHGIGLAAPQVGSPIRLFILRNYIQDEAGHITLTHPQIYINPKVTVLSKETFFGEEGCLSIPGVREEVERPLKIRVEAHDVDGNPFVEEVEGYKARVILHENDHLNGVLFIDRIDPEVRKRLAPRLKEIKKSHPY